MKYYLTVLVIFFLSCSKKPKFPIEPQIEFGSLSNDFIDFRQNNTDSIVWITVSFKDGDGDLGIPEDNNISNRFLIDGNNCVIGKYGDQVDTSIDVSVVEANVLFTDSRNGCTLYHKFQEIPTKGNVKAISGSITFKVSYTNFCHPAYCKNKMDTISYNIKVVDRAEHTSNSVSTPPIILIYTR